MRLSPLTRLRQQAGYTLIEMAMVLGIAGMIMGTAMAAYRVYEKNRAYNVTIENINQVSATMNAYLARFGRYPCPAQLDLPRDDDEYGMEGQCDRDIDQTVINNQPVGSKDPRGAYTLPPGGLGNCGNGVCVSVSNRAATPVPTGADSAKWPPRVRRGAIPFRILNIPEDTTFDGSRTRLQYVVTENLAVAKAYDPAHGGITILDRDGHSAITPPSTAQFLVFSTGQDMKGAYSMDGLLVNACAGDTAAKDGENCDSDSTFLISQLSTADSTSHYDDSMKFYSSVNRPLWKVADDAGVNIVDMIHAGNAGKVGFAMDPSKYTLTVTKAMRANTVAGDSESGKVIVDTLCATDDNGLNDPTVAPTNCFKPGRISAAAGTPANGGGKMQCPRVGMPGDYVTGINADGGSFGQVTCAPNAIGYTCPTGQYVTGIDNNGKITCGRIGFCPPRTVGTWCGGDFTIPATDSGDPGIFSPSWDPTGTWFGVPGYDLTPSIPGDYRGIDYYKCTAGEWTYGGDNSGDRGLPVTIDGEWCALPAPCEPLDETVDDEVESCVDWYAWETWRIPGTYTGSVTKYRHTRECPSRQEDWEVLEGNCVCQPVPDNHRTYPCADWSDDWNTGDIQITDKWVCDANPHWDTQPFDFSQCAKTCTPHTNPRTDACGFGYQSGGVRNMEQNVTCDADMNEVNGPWTEVSNTCVCSPATNVTHPSCPENQTGSLEQTISIDCSTGTPQITDVITGTCTCPAGQTRQQVATCAERKGTNWVGNIDVTQTFNCTSKQWEETSAVEHCSVGARSWVAGGPPSVSTYGTTQGYPRAGDGCPSAGAIDTCMVAVSGGYKKYPSCSCQ